MLIFNQQQNKKLVLKLLNEEPEAAKGDLFKLVKKILTKRAPLLNLAQKHPTPFYVFDQKECAASARDFLAAFGPAIPNFKAYYAIKSNPYPGIIKTVLSQGFGLDVSSGRELAIGLKCGAREIIFSGPGKTIEELNLAVKNNQTTTINLDSFGELKRLAELLQKKDASINAGVRVSTKYHRAWNKFGIPLNDLKNFFQEAKKYPRIKLAGIQCHLSFNQNAQPYQNAICAVGKYLRNNFTVRELREIKFFDFGGGFLPHLTEADQPWESPQGQIYKIASEYFGRELRFKEKCYPIKTIPLKDYAAKISQTLKKYITPLLPDCYFCAEPGQIISSKAMHIVIRIIDIKSKNMAIADGGNNMIGWEKFDAYYAPLVNLTNPGDKEIKLTVYGSLCLPEDIWGRWCYAKKIAVGDVIVIPFVGAYTYTFAQNFIKPIPKTYILK